MAFSLTAHWAGRSIYDIDPGALASRGIRLLLPIWTTPWCPMGCRSPPNRCGSGTGHWRITASPSLSCPITGIPGGRSAFPRPGGPLHRPCRQTQARLLLQSHGADGVYGGADRHRGGPDLYRYSGRPERRGTHPAGGAHPPGGQPGRYLRYAVEWPFRALTKRRTKSL